MVSVYWYCVHQNSIHLMLLLTYIRVDKRFALKTNFHRNIVKLTSHAIFSWLYTMDNVSYYDLIILIKEKDLMNVCWSCWNGYFTNMSLSYHNALFCIVPCHWYIKVDRSTWTLNHSLPTVHDIFMFHSYYTLSNIWLKCKGKHQFS